jgi:hypothetical protein
MTGGLENFASPLIAGVKLKQPTDCYEESGTLAG